MVFRALLLLTLVLYLSQALPIKKANKEIAEYVKEGPQKRLVKRSEEIVKIGNHQNEPRIKPPDADAAEKSEQNRDENAKVEVNAKELDTSDLEGSDEANSVPLQAQAMEQAVMDLAKVAKAPPEDSSEESDETNERIKIVEEEKELEKLPKNANIAEDSQSEIEEDEAYQPVDVFDQIAAEQMVNSEEAPDEEGEVTDSSEERPNMNKNLEQPNYEFGDYSLYTDPYRWFDRKKRDAERRKREAVMRGSEAGMAMVANDDKKSRSKRDTNYPLSLNDLYNLYYKYKVLQEEEKENEMEPLYEVPDYSEEDSSEYEYEMPPPQDWEPEAVNDEIRKELEYDALMQAPAVEEEAPYYLMETPPMEEEPEEEDVPAWEVPSETVFYPMEYEPVARPDEEEEEEVFIPAKREMLSFMPGIKKSDDFYPYYTEEQEPWQALIPPAAEKRGVMEEYARLYRLARALKRSREDTLEERWERLLDGYDEKK